MQDIKAQAKNAKKALGDIGIEVSIGQAQQLVARMGGFRSYQAARKALQATQVSPALLDLMTQALDRLADGESFNEVVEQTGITARVSEARQQAVEDPYRKALIVTLGIFGRLEISSAGGLWNLLGVEALSDAIEGELEWMRDALLSQRDKEDLAKNWGVTIDSQGTLSVAAPADSWDAVRQHYVHHELDFTSDVDDGARVSYFVAKPEGVAYGFKVSARDREKFAKLQDVAEVWLLPDALEVIHQDGRSERFEVVNGKVQEIDASAQAIKPCCPKHARFPGDSVGCGSTNVAGPDEEGFFDCQDCGLFFKAEASPESHSDGEILGVENDGKVIQWSADGGCQYVSGMTLDDFPLSGMTPAEVDRIKVTEAFRRFDQEAKVFADACWEALCREKAEDESRETGYDVEDLLLAGVHPDKLDDSVVFRKVVEAQESLKREAGFDRLRSSDAFCEAVYRHYLKA